MDNPASTAQASLESLNASAREFAASVFSTLEAGHGAETETIIKALTAAAAQNNEELAALQQRFYQRHLELWMSLAQAGQATPREPLVVEDQADRRFRAPEWEATPYFAYLKQAYLLNSRWLSEIVETLPLGAKTKHKLRFFTRQMIDAAAPANFAATNPEVLKLSSETQGESMRQGLELLNADLKKGRITMTDESAFEIGRNIATTPGDVVFENELLQLIQYQPGTDSVYERPLLMVPPFINKYYVLDLQPHNSLVHYAVSQGHTVFMISWRNMPPEMGHLTWDDYVETGVIKALDVAREICGANEINTLGFCVGGTLLASALAVLRAGNRNPAASVTLLAAMLDFSDTGDLAVFVDDAYVQQREQEYAHGGVMHGRQLALTFSSLRPNDLIWNYVVNNYLKGRKPAAFDLLFWNSDSTNLPGAMYVYYLRNMYLQNSLRQPGRLAVRGVPVDLSRIEAPAYLLASREDHIVPWKTAYQSTQLLSGPIEFVLAASGHIAGVINPASKNQRHYSLNSMLPRSAEDWLAGAVQHPGSWWSHWSAWLAEHGGEQVPARTGPGNAQYRGIEAAPGRYVKETCD